jgi:hypothetical protein
MLFDRRRIPGGFGDGLHCVLLLHILVFLLWLAMVLCLLSMKSFVLQDFKGRNDNCLPRASWKIGMADLLEKHHERSHSLDN